MAKRVVAQAPAAVPVGAARGATEFGWHALEAFMRCLKEGQFKHVRKIVTPQQVSPDALAIGSLVHAGRARWFAQHFKTDTKAWEAVSDAVAQEAQLATPPVSPRAEQEAMKIIQLYVDHWSRRPLPKAIAAEYTLGPAPIVPGDPDSVRTARLDDVSWYPDGGGVVALGECKTTSTSVADCVNQYTLHGQILLQMLLWKLAEQGEATHGPIGGVMLDIIVKPYKHKKAVFARHYLPVADNALRWFVRTMHHHIKVSRAVDWNTDVPRNLTACTRIIGRARVPCQYRELCQHGRSASSNYTFADGSSLLSWKPSPEKEVEPWK